MITKIRQKIKLTPKKLSNKEGAVLIISMFVLTVLFGLTACFSLASVGELKESNRYLDSTEAFWAAEAAINRFIQNTNMLDSGDVTLTFGESSVFLEKDDSDASVRVVTATATANGVERVIEVEFPAGIPSIFQNTISSGGNFTYDGHIILWGDTSLTADGQTQISGSYTESGPTGGGVSNLDEGVNSGLTTLTYPDVDANDTADEFTDFAEFYRHMTDETDPDFTGEYTSDEVVYIPDTGTVNLWPSSNLNDKKVIFVDGGAAGVGHANIWLDTTWAANQNMTVVATGAVNFILPLENPVANSQLHTVSWSNYSELGIIYSNHTGLNYSHSQVVVDQIAGTGVTNGSIIGNTGVDVDLWGGFGIDSNKIYDYLSPLDTEGAVPPGFQGLVSGGTSGYLDTPDSWSEI